MIERILKRIGCAEADCPGTLAPVPGGELNDGQLWNGIVACESCDGEYPVLGGVPIVVPRTSHWIATYRESILASLAEVNLCSPRAVEEIAAFADRLGPVEPMRFGDDWTTGEVAPAQPEWPKPTVAGDAGQKFEEFLKRARAARPEDLILDALGPDGTEVVELGVGAGRFTQELVASGRHVIAADHSLRAVLHACRDRNHVAGVVVDAEDPPLLPETADAVVALELIDLLDAPRQFLVAIRRGLATGGRLYLSTPNPEACGLDTELARAEFVVKADLDGVPWVRAHTRRHYQVYFTRVVVAERESPYPGDAEERPSGAVG